MISDCGGGDRMLERLADDVSRLLQDRQQQQGGAIQAASVARLNHVSDPALQCHLPAFAARIAKLDGWQDIHVCV